RCRGDSMSINTEEKPAGLGVHSLLRADSATSAIPPLLVGGEIPDLGACKSFMVPSSRGYLRLRIASKRDEFEQVFALLATNYRARGYEVPGDHAYRYTAHHILPDTIVLIAEREDRVHATMSLVPDTALRGLPIETTFGAEIAG